MNVQFRRILLATDFSPLSAAATDYACEIADRFDAELHIIHTLEYHLEATPVFELGLAMSTYIQESRTAAQESLGKVLDGEWAAKHRVVFAILDGTPKTEIVQYASQEKCDLIVLSTHGRTGLTHVLMGSVAEYVVRTSPCPVMTIRPVASR